jgi:hypothetical protein
MPTPKSKLSKFILSLPATLTGSQVVERAKAKGMKTSRANVSRVRGMYGTKAVKTRAPITSPTSKTEPAKPATTAPSNSPPKNKSDFIRAQPASLSAAEVIAKGKAEGIKLGSSLVYMVRRRSPGKAKTGAAETVATKPTAAPAKTKSKADFVRAYPDLSPKEFVEKAKAEGIKLGWRYVYNVRASDKAARKKNRATSTTSSKPASTNGTLPSVTPWRPNEDLLKALAAELGLGRAVEILCAERARVRAMIGGEPRRG